MITVCTGKGLASQVPIDLDAITWQRFVARLPAPVNAVTLKIQPIPHDKLRKCEAKPESHMQRNLPLEK